MKTNIFLTAASVLVASLMVSNAFAQSSTTTGQTTFDQNHPRRAQVNQRLQNQNGRVDNKVANGTMSQGEANKIHRQDKAIHREEKADAAANGGHITKAEQKQINHQENHVSKEIKNH